MDPIRKQQLRALYRIIDEVHTRISMISQWELEEAVAIEIKKGISPASQAKKRISKELREYSQDLFLVNLQYGNIKLEYMP